ncbi:C-X-C motif chemokine 13 [Pipistrellus kuhlii]|uniref:C-X-C motif chemokine 13 n=1 Tax=Pipistrellus kuhlii TaxID=59472 RepID=UPI001E27495A|nr:C-X-C motif chemokine 13 [Pipistrellus kuhlii]
MRFIPGCLLLLLLISSLSPAHGVLEAWNTNFKCKCMKSVSRLNKRSIISNISRVAAYMPGDHCPRKEVIVWLKNGPALCLNPESEWTQRLLKNVQKSNSLPSDRKPT